MSLHAAHKINIDYNNKWMAKLTVALLFGTALNNQLHAWSYPTRLTFSSETSCVYARHTDRHLIQLSASITDVFISMTCLEKEEHGDKILMVSFDIVCSFFNLTSKKPLTENLQVSMFSITDVYWWSWRPNVSTFNQVLITVSFIDKASRLLLSYVSHLLLLCGLGSR